MFGFRDHSAQVRQLFEEQFEPYEGGYTYRRSQKGPPVRVTASERQLFLDQFQSRLRFASRALVLGTFMIAGIFVWFSVASVAAPPEAFIYTGFGVLLAVFMGFYFWAWAAPARELSRRAPMGEARTGAEMRRRMLEKISYGQLATAAFAGVLLPIMTWDQYEGFSGWRIAWPIFGAALVLLAAVQAVRKWWFNKEHRRRAP